jgi:type IV pilus assembly protein PilX
MSTHRRQRGTALVTSLLLLLILTVVGVTAMQVTRMQERMAGNTRDLNLAFQGAEAALRNGEDMIAAEAFAPSPAGGVCTAAPCKFFDANAAAAANLETKDYPWWTTSAIPTEYEASGTHTGTPTADMDTLAHDPLFVVEYVAEVPDTYSIGSGVGPPSSRFFYQVTAGSPGATKNAITVLQSTYARR